VHNALRSWFGLPVRRRTPEAVPGLLAGIWVSEGYRDAGQEKAARRRAEGWVESYVEHLDPADEPAGLERVVGTRTETLALSGRVDRIDERDGELVVVDYKTGRARLSEDDARGSRALAVYAVAASRTLRRPCHRVELHHLPTEQVYAAEHTEQSLARHVRRSEETAADVVHATERVNEGADPDETFPTRTGPHCSWCDYRRHCPTGRAAAPDRVSWAALPNDL
jgi:RecB family exonuclease